MSGAKDGARGGSGARDRMSEMMARLLRDAGIGAGMRVLDVGCGHGRVSRMIAALVGEGGAVIGLDRDAGAVDTARAAMRASGIANAEFVCGDLCALPAGLGDFDAIVGRRVLMYQRDRVAALRSLVSVLRPGGLAVFQEVDGTMVPASSAPCPLHEQVHRWIWQTVESEGATTSMGLELPGALAEVGLMVEDLRAEAVVQTAERRHNTAEIVRAILPRIVASGAATAAEVDADTLDERLAEELHGQRASFIGDMVFGVWARKPR
ncbi:methyltransferase domain-containing protein [Haliangium ochraceum]|uniref:Methyltransferase type 11 n=1 Tax=Haliangium ochraceum (strain DSM 14365 / JCM 11303 / SMP-2) TaxID=502025 RepID=D0LNK5_HALO1|nr:methyltransferase domain-containing protein [Haliangium ochraceum]ACY16910.1 Methyltransferase type 11 [Haliangium ochraceum DSM 14365]